MKKADIERMISLADDRYIDEIFRDKITGRRKNIFVTFTAVAAALALVAGGISYFVSNAGNADKIVADDTIVSELGIVDYSLYFQNTKMEASEVIDDDWAIETDGIFCYFSDSEYVKSVMPFDMSRFVNASCHFYYNYKDEVKTILMNADNRTDDLQENVKSVSVAAFERGEWFPHLSLGKYKSMKRFDVDVYGFDFRETENFIGVIFAADGKEYYISGENISYDEIGLIMDSVIENGLWTDSFDLSRAEMEYGDISADITLGEANFIEPFAGYVPQVHKFGDMTLNFNKVSYQAGRDEANGIVPQWLYFTYYDGGEQDICLQYFTDDADVQPLEKTVAIDDIDLDKLSEFRHDGNNHTFTIDFGNFKVNVWTNNCTDDVLMECINAIRGGDVVSGTVTLAEANNIVPFAGHVPQFENIGNMKLLDPTLSESANYGKTLKISYNIEFYLSNIHQLSATFTEKKAWRENNEPLVSLDEITKEGLEKFKTDEISYDGTGYYQFSADCGGFFVTVNAWCTPEELWEYVSAINPKAAEQVGVRLSNGVTLVDSTLSAANKIQPFAGYVPQLESFGDMKLSAVSEGYFDGNASPSLLHTVYVDDMDNPKKMLTAHFYSDYKAVFLDVPKVSAIPLADISPEKIKEYGGNSFIVDCGEFYILIGANPRCTPEEVWAYIGEIKGTAASDANDKSGNLLTIDKVKELAKKGDDLTWSDFDGYTFTEGGSGLYIRSYAVEGGYNLMVSGTGRETKPMYIYLSCEGKGKIDIRYDSIDEFLNEN